MPELQLAARRLAGAPDLPDVLLVGAGLGTSAAALWGSTAALLGARFEVLGVDLPGHGGSRAVDRGFTVADVADAVRELAQQEAAGRGIWYAGVSFAGGVALDLARDAGPVQGVVAVAAASTFGTPDAWQQRAELVCRQGTAVLVDASTQRWFTPAFAAERPDLVEHLLDDLRHADDVSYALCCLALADFDVRAVLPHLQVPVLLMPGELDTVVPPDRVAEDARSLPGGRLAAIPGVAHQPPMEAPTAVAAVLTDFIDEQRTRT